MTNNEQAMRIEMVLVRMLMGRRSWSDRMDILGAIQATQHHAKSMEDEAAMFADEEPNCPNGSRADPADEETT